MDGNPPADLAGSTLDTRMKMYALCLMGMTEEEALEDVLCEEDDRMEQMALWKQQGLWPPPEFGGSAELVESTPQTDLDFRIQPSDDHEPEAPDRSISDIQGLINTTVNAALLDYDRVLWERIERVVTEIVSERLRRVEHGPTNRAKTLETAADTVEMTVTMDSRIARLLEAEGKSLGIEPGRIVASIVRDYYEGQSEGEGE